MNSTLHPSPSPTLVLHVLVIDNHEGEPVPHIVDDFLKMVDTTNHSQNGYQVRAQRFDDVLNARNKLCPGYKEQLLTTQLKSVFNGFDFAVAVAASRPGRNAGEYGAFWLKVGFWTGRRGEKDIVFIRGPGVTLPTDLSNSNWDFPEAKSASEIWLTFEKKLRTVADHDMLPGHRNNLIKQITSRPGGNAFQLWPASSFFQAGSRVEPWPNDLIVPTLSIILALRSKNQALIILIELQNIVENLVRASFEINNKLKWVGGNPDGNSTVRDKGEISTLLTDVVFQFLEELSEALSKLKNSISFQKSIWTLLLRLLLWANVPTELRFYQDFPSQRVKNDARRLVELICQFSTDHRRFHHTQLVSQRITPVDVRIESELCELLVLLSLFDDLSSELSVAIKSLTTFAAEAVVSTTSSTLKEHGLLRFVRKVDLLLATAVNKTLGKLTQSLESRTEDFP